LLSLTFISDFILIVIRALAKLDCGLRAARMQIAAGFRVPAH
jgi:hypothetical protein